MSFIRKFTERDDDLYSLLLPHTMSCCENVIAVLLSNEIVKVQLYHSLAFENFDYESFLFVSYCENQAVSRGLAHPKFGIF